MQPTLKAKIKTHRRNNNFKSVFLCSSIDTSPDDDDVLTACRAGRSNTTQSKPQTQLHTIATKGPDHCRNQTVFAFLHFDVSNACASADKPVFVVLHCATVTSKYL
jgi:hypothetical protein